MDHLDVRARAVAEEFGLSPLPVEGGLYRRTWAGPVGADGRPAGSAIVVLLAPGEFSALHRLPVDEVWHFYRGDPLDLLLLHPDGSSQVVALGPGGGVQCAVPAGTWMAAESRGRWSLCGTTMAPGFVPSDYEGGDADHLAARYPEHARRVRRLCRATTTMPGDLPEHPGA